jgi:hypothetical protein
MAIPVLVIEALAAGIKPALDKIISLIPDKNAADKARTELMNSMMALSAAQDTQQVEVNKIEAGSASLFVAGWRPAIGWVCAAAMAVYYIPRFFLGTGLWAWQVIQLGQLIPMPEMGIGDIMGLLGSMLGIGVMRTVEKLGGVTTGMTAAPKFDVPTSSKTSKRSEFNN